LPVPLQLAVAGDATVFEVVIWDIPSDCEQFLVLLKHSRKSTSHN